MADENNQGAEDQGGQGDQSAVDKNPAAGAEASAAAAAAAGGKAATVVDKTLAGGGKVDKTAEATWPADWRERMARTHAGQDDKAYGKELKRLQRFTDPSAVYGSARELEGRFSEGGLVKVPGAKATDEERSAFRKALGVPEKPEDYFAKLEIPDGRVLGDDDKPVADAFAKAMHGHDLTPKQLGAAIGWYQSFQEQEAADTVKADQAFRAEAETALKKEWGASFQSNINAIASLFANAPGGAAAEGDSLMARLLGGRTADGKLIGDDPVITKFLAGLALELNPAATIVPDSNDAGRSIADELAGLRKMMAKQDSDYWVGPNAARHQARAAELLAAQEKLKAREQRAA